MIDFAEAECIKCVCSNNLEISLQFAWEWVKINFYRGVLVFILINIVFFEILIVQVNAWWLDKFFAVDK